MLNLSAFCRLHSRFASSWSSASDALSLKGKPRERYRDHSAASSSAPRTCGISDLLRSRAAAASTPRLAADSCQSPPLMRRFAALCASAEGSIHARSTFLHIKICAVSFFGVLAPYMASHSRVQRLARAGTACSTVG